MSALDELIQEIADENLRRRIEKEIAALKRSKKFGLVFEPQNPECTPLYDVPVKKKSLVALKAGKVDDVYCVIKIDGDNANCIRLADGEQMTCNVDDLISVAQFGTPIYPYLQPLDTVCNAPESNLWHALIESDNYHALQLLKYLYGGKVDCIYIDPPYNTGARDWKYNNDYVDASNEYRHSKWLAMMERRLKLAKELLSDSGAIFISIDDNEQARLKLLCDEIFGVKNFIAQIPWRKRTAKSDVPCGISQDFESILCYANENFIGGVKGKSRRYFETEDFPGRPWRFHDLTTQRTADERPNSFFTIVNPKNGKAYPANPNSTWRVTKETFQEYYAANRIIFPGDYPFLKISKPVLRYWKADDVAKAGGNFGMVAASTNLPETVGMTQDGTKELTQIFGDKRFAFPKPIQLIKHLINIATIRKPDALIVDFFAGSGTTLHAVNLLNAEDGGQRRCILVTNNEVSDAEEKSLRKQGFTPADIEWQKLGVARYVTWQRTVCSIEGHDINGAPLKGNYLGTEILMADGFKANVAFFKLGFLDKDYVALGRQFKELLPVLWFKAGCRGKCPTVDENLPPMMILPANNFAVLIDEKFFADFEGEVLNHAEIDTIFIITDSEYGYRAMIKNFGDKTTYQLYRDYLENFRISG